ncbi:hypothetical protein KIPB_003540 [Kipferlia bialata]|uniref:Uncharacterized protein n=1 Tax=Kipferlia bialata TaxID=797122 RepID=A0A9K3GFU1_9EUKA|nr:hypothetical protein KIPB_003540 [Kipferlia bialata]|eukprot:g3540.t1
MDRGFPTIPTVSKPLSRSYPKHLASLPVSNLLEEVQDPETYTVQRKPDLPPPVPSPAPLRDFKQYLSKYGDLATHFVLLSQSLDQQHPEEEEEEGEEGERRPESTPALARKGSSVRVGGTPMVSGYTGHSAKATPDPRYRLPTPSELGEYIPAGSRLSLLSFRKELSKRHQAIPDRYFSNDCVISAEEWQELYTDPDTAAQLIEHLKTLKMEIVSVLSSRQEMSTQLSQHLKSLELSTASAAAAAEQSDSYISSIRKTRIERSLEICSQTPGQPSLFELCDSHHLETVTGNEVIRPDSESDRPRVLTPGQIQSQLLSTSSVVGSLLDTMGGLDSLLSSYSVQDNGLHLPTKYDLATRMALSKQGCLKPVSDTVCTVYPSRVKLRHIMLPLNGTVPPSCPFFYMEVTLPSHPCVIGLASSVRPQDGRLGEINHSLGIETSSGVVLANWGTNCKIPSPFKPPRHMTGVVSVLALPQLGFVVFAENGTAFEPPATLPPSVWTRPMTPVVDVLAPRPKKGGRHKASEAEGVTVSVRVGEGCKYSPLSIVQPIPKVGSGMHAYLKAILGESK